MISTGIGQYYHEVWFSYKKRSNRVSGHTTTTDYRWSHHCFRTTHGRLRLKWGVFGTLLRKPVLLDPIFRNFNRMLKETSQRGFQTRVLRKRVYILRNGIITSWTGKAGSRKLWKHNVKRSRRAALGGWASKRAAQSSELDVGFLMLSLPMYWVADRESDPSGWLAAHFAGRWQTIRHTNLCLLMTLKHETKLYAGPSDLCESISKIILFAVATHFRLPPPITALSGDGDRLELRAVRGRFCSIRSQRPLRPQSLLSSTSPRHLHATVPSDRRP